MSHFTFLQAEWPDLYHDVRKAESRALVDPRTACFYARRSLELAMRWIYAHDPSLSLPYRDDLSALIHEPTFKAAAGQAVFVKTRAIKDLGNHAVHSHRPISQNDSVAAVRELFHVCFWLAHTYARGEQPQAGLAFDSAKLPRAASPAQTQAQLQKLAGELKDRNDALAELMAGKAALDEELQKLRAEIAEAKKVNAAVADTHDYSEAETRDYFIDLLLKEAGWALDDKRDREFPVTGMPNATGQGFVDYVLWGDDGKPLAVVEAKRARQSLEAGRQQAKLYADCLENTFGQRPVIFTSNGYEHDLWDDASYPPRAVHGFYKKSELALIIHRRASRKPLAEAEIDATIAGRYYQTRAIRRIGEAFERDQERKALVVMATGAGKTRTVVALSELLMRCNWAKRVLFLADRVALVNQAVGAFKKFLPDASPVNLVTEKDTEGRVYVSTYPTMMGLIDEARDGVRRFGPGHFDLIIIDEAHRSVFQKYRHIFNYFDSFLVGLTATPKSEIDRNTYRLFELQTGVPTDAYELADAVSDGYLVPAKGVSVPLQFQREGIRYDELSKDEREAWDAAEWDEEDGTPDHVDPEVINKWLFNADTVDKVLEHLMTHGLTVAGGDRLGKTIIFAKNNAHAEFIADRFDANYPNLKGEFARVITFKTKYAQSLIDAFSEKEKAPHIAISVDMLDTGIDVPEVLNLVFFKVIRSKTKFEQMVGRGTRLCPDLFSPGEDKREFYIFDFCQNLEYFNQELPPDEGRQGDPLRKRLFNTRIRLIRAMDERLGLGIAYDAEATYGEPSDDAAVRREMTETLRREVASMRLENFVVRPQRRLVEHFATPEAWVSLADDSTDDLMRHVAGLPNELEPEPEEAKRFDMLMLNLELCVLQGKGPFKALCERAMAIGGLLEAKSSIPMIQAELTLIQAIQTDEWWQDVTVPILESARKRLRHLVRLIDKRQRAPIYTDFEDTLGAGVEIPVPGFTRASGFALFREKARAFLRSHADHLVVRKLRMNKPLTPSDLDELEHLLAGSGAGAPEDLQRAAEEAQGLGLFVRSLVGLDREAAKDELNAYIGGKALAANQLEFLDLIVNHLTESGIMAPDRLYESPFTDLNPQGPEGLFDGGQIDALIEWLETVRARAIAS